VHGATRCLVIIVCACSAATGHNRLRNGAHAVAWHLARKGYLIAYLTGRPDYHSASTRRWLAAHEMPVGPILAAGTHGDSMRSRGRAAAMAAAIDRGSLQDSFFF
jgi:hypothetical protein